MGAPEWILAALVAVVDTTTLAEDTVTTSRIQLAGKRVVFDQGRAKPGRGWDKTEKIGAVGELG